MRPDTGVVVAGYCKWLMAGGGAAFLYANRDWIERMRPSSVGWMSFRQDPEDAEYRLSYRHDAWRFIAGSANMSGLTAFVASPSFIIEIVPIPYNVEPRSSTSSM